MAAQRGGEIELQRRLPKAGELGLGESRRIGDVHPADLERGAQRGDELERPLQAHLAPATTSDFAFKGALRDHATAVWRGMIRVAEDAQKTNAYQENRNLLLSDQAHADSIPGLEIEANDVRCTHGATVSQVDRDELFYCMARGLSRGEAERRERAGGPKPDLESGIAHRRRSPRVHKIEAAPLDGVDDGATKLR